MISFFPEIYPDELLYSVIARYHQRSGYVLQISTFEDIYKNRSVLPSIDFVNPYTEDAYFWMTKNSSFEDLILKHTMFPFFVCFLPPERKKVAFEALKKQEGNWANTIGIKKKGDRFLRYCYKCACEDREKYGETYWHRAHQILRVNVCPIHGCYLKNTHIRFSSRQSPALYDAESVVPYDEVSEMCAAIERELANYVYSVLSSVDIFRNIDIGSFLHFHLDKKYMNSGGILRNFAALYNDFSDFYEGIQMPEVWQMQKIFHGNLRDPYFICQIAYFEGVAVNELISDKMLYLDTETEIFYRGLSEKYDIDIALITEIGKEIGNYIYACGRSNTKPGRKKMCYEKLDMEMLPKVKKYVKELYSEGRKPQKLSLRKIENTFSIPRKRLNKMNKCKEFILKNMESQEVFWAREVEWAVKEIQNQEDPLNWKHIRNLTHMRPRDLVSCYQYIQNEEIRNVIKDIIEKLSISN